MHIHTRFLAHHLAAVAAGAGLLMVLTPVRSLAAGTDNTKTGTGALTADTTGSNNTADGFDALAHNTTASSNTAVGANALLTNTTGNHNTATGAGALQNNANGHENTADGFDALQANSSGFHDTALGHETLLHNTSGTENTAAGYEALFQNSIGNDNVAIGSNSLLSNLTGDDNTAVGAAALEGNLSGIDNVAVGAAALDTDTSGQGNTAVGYEALASNTGNFNIAIGDDAGTNLTTGNGNIDISNAGEAGESDTIRIGLAGTQTQTFIAGIYGYDGLSDDATVVYIDTTGQLGTGEASGVAPGDIHTMNRSSEAIYALRPVSYRLGDRPGRAVRFGLLADEVARVNPALVTHGKDGQPATVRYEQVNAMLLNEFLKAHSQIESQAAKLAALEAALARQQAALDALRAR